MLHFVLRTSDPSLTRWQIHRAQCADALAMLRNGASVEVASKKPAKAIVVDEIAEHREGGSSGSDFAIMDCCLD